MAESTIVKKFIASLCTVTTTESESYVCRFLFCVKCKLHKISRMKNSTQLAPWIRFNGHEVKVNPHEVRFVTYAKLDP